MRDSILRVRSSGLGSLQKLSKKGVDKLDRSINRKIEHHVKSQTTKRKVSNRIMSKREYIKTIPEKEKREWAKDVGGLKQAYRDAYSGYKIGKGQKPLVREAHKPLLQSVKVVKPKSKKEHGYKWNKEHTRIYYD